MRVFLFVVAVLASTQAGAAEARVLGALRSPLLHETSGIAVSRLQPDLMWGINDSGNPAELHAFRPNGTDLGQVKIERARNLDWEDLASFRLDGISYLLIADSGDNQARRRISHLYIVEEPSPDPAGRFSGAIKLVTRLPFYFEDGPRDCEAVAVDVSGDRILLVSKSDSPPRLYEMPLTLVDRIRRPLVARFVGTVSFLPRPTLAEFFESPLLGPWRHQPTAIELTEDASTLGLMTFSNLYLYQRDKGQPWGEVVGNKPSVVSLATLAQTESLAFWSGNAVTVSEGRSAAILDLGPVSASATPDVGPM